MLCDYAYKLGKNIFYRNVHEIFYIVDKPDRRLYSESYRMKFIKDTDKFISDSEAYLSLYSDSGAKLSTLKFDHLNSIDDIIYIEELDSYIFAYSRPYKDSYIFLWKPN